MAEMDMVERVAKAILAESQNMGALAHHLNGENALEIRLARAAIEAMREPTEAMQAAMDEHAGTIAPIYAYEAAIDAALSDTSAKG